MTLIWAKESWSAPAFLDGAGIGPAHLVVGGGQEREQQPAATFDNRMARRELKAAGAKRTARPSGTQRARDPQSGVSESEAGQHE